VDRARAAFDTVKLRGYIGGNQHRTARRHPVTGLSLKFVVFGHNFPLISRLVAGRITEVGYRFRRDTPTEAGTLALTDRLCHRVSPR
jgi:hypothetical protein